MTAYAFWNNKGGVDKSFLSFVAATKYARAYTDNYDLYLKTLYFLYTLFNHETP